MTATYNEFSALESGSTITMQEFNAIFANSDTVTIKSDNVRGAETVSKSAVAVGAWVNNGTYFIEVVSGVTTITYGDKTYTLTQDAYLNEDSSGVHFAAHAVDADGAEYNVRWTPSPDFDAATDDDYGDACDWTQPTLYDMYGYQLYLIDDLIADLDTGDYGAELADHDDDCVCDAIAEIADSNTSIYYSDIIKFIGDNPHSLADVIEESLYDPSHDYDLYKHGQAAEYMTIEQDIYEHLSDSLKYHAYLYCKKTLQLSAIPENLDMLICVTADAEDNNARLDYIPAAIDAWIAENGGDN